MTRKMSFMNWTDFLPVFLKQIRAESSQLLKTAQDFEALITGNTAKDPFTVIDEPNYRQIGFLNEKTRCWYYMGLPTAKTLAQGDAPYLKTLLCTSKGRTFLALYMTMGIIPPVLHDPEAQIDISLGWPTSTTTPNSRGPAMAQKTSAPKPKTTKQWLSQRREERQERISSWMSRWCPTKPLSSPV